MPGIGTSLIPFHDADGTYHPSGSTVTRVEHAVDATLTAADSGKVHVTTAVDVVLTLPPTESGLTFTVVAGVLSATTGASVSPDAADQVIGLGFTGLDDKDAINTAATDVVGDSITLLGDGVDGWLIINAQGVWAREA
jgi:hypothetical protein